MLSKKCRINALALRLYWYCLCKMAFGVSGIHWLPPMLWEAEAKSDDIVDDILCFSPIPLFQRIIYISWYALARRLYRRRNIDFYFFLNDGYSHSRIGAQQNSQPPLFVMLILNVAKCDAPLSDFRASFLIMMIDILSFRGRWVSYSVCFEQHALQLISMKSFHFEVVTCNITASSIFWSVISAEPA